MLDIALILTITREDLINDLIKDLENLYHEPATTDLIIVIDCDLPLVRIKLKTWANEKQYRTVNIIMNRDNIVRHHNIVARRFRIAYVKEQTRQVLKTVPAKYVFCIEDDTKLTSNSLFELSDKYYLKQARYNIGFIEGVQAGRHSIKMIGAWQLKRQVLTTLLPPKTANTDKTNIITAGGFYLYYCSREVYLLLEYTYNNEPYGPDVVWGASNRLYK